MEHLVELMEDHSTDHFVMARDCHLYRNNKDSIRWKNDTDNNYTIHFDECPFRENDFTVFAHSEKGPVELDSTVLATTHVNPKTYAYGISLAAVKSSSVMAADPNVIVH